MRCYTMIAALLLAVSLYGCGMMQASRQMPEEPVEPPEPVAFRQPVSTGWQADTLISQSHVAADGLVSNLDIRLPKGANILAATFVNLDNFDESSSFGRLLGSQFVTRLAQAGYGVMEVRLRRQMGFRLREGEFALSRKTAQFMRQKFDARAILVGNYTVDDDAVFVSSRVVRLDNGVVLAAYDFAVPNEGMVERMLDKGAQPVEFDTFLRSRDVKADNMTAASGSSVPTVPLQEIPLGQPPVEEGGPFRLFPPTRLQ